LIFLFIYLIGLLFTWESGERIPTEDPAEAISTVPFLPENPIDLNTADLYDLQLLPFIGPGYAMRILEYREKRGGFKDIRELKSIKGINEYRFEKLKPYVTIP